LAAYAAIGGDAQGLIFSTPGIYLNRKRMKLPFSIPKFLFSKNKTYYPSIIPAYGDDNGASMFTAQESYFLKIKNDLQSLRSFTRRFYLETSKLDRFIQKRCKNIEIPSLLLLVGDDGMMDNQKIQKFFKDRFRKLDFKVYQTEKKHQHYLMFTSARARAFDDVEAFVRGLL
jgi:esterase/lipase